MNEALNLQESPFIDKRNSQQKNFTIGSQNIMENLPSDEQSIEYKLHTKFEKYDETPFLIPDKNHRLIIDEIIKEYRAGYRLSIPDDRNIKFRSLFEKHTSVLQIYYDKEYPQAIFILMKYEGYGPLITLSLDKLVKICEKSKYPLLMTFANQHIKKYQVMSEIYAGFGMFGKESKLTGKQFQEYQKTTSKYLDYCLRVGLPEAFIQNCIKLQGLKEGIKSYEMAKNAQKLGYEPVAYKHLVDLFSGSFLTKDVSKNLRITDKYLKKSKQLGIFTSQQLKKVEKQIEDQKKKEIQIINSIKSTINTRSVQVASFIKVKVHEQQTLKEYNSPYRFNWGSQNNMANNESYSLFNPPKIFYVVFSPQMNFPGRHFLAKDINGQIQMISLYNWDLVPINKLKLLHQLGTKIVLNEYIRKISSGQQLPIYRIDNPHSMEIHQRTQVHKIEDSQFRNLAKNLFERGLLDMAIILYEHLVRRKAQELQIVYSNMGLIKQKQNSISEAIEFYEKSLSIKPFEKSQIRLARILIDKKEYNKAQNIIKEIKSQNERSSIQKFLQQAKQDEVQTSNFSKVIKNKHKLVKNIEKTGDLLKINGGLKQVNPTAMFNIRQLRPYLVYYRIFFYEILTKKDLTENQYISELQSIYDNIEKGPLKKADVQKFLDFAYRTYSIRQQTGLYPKASNYLAAVFLESLYIPNNTQYRLESTAIAHLALRQNFLENRIEDLALSFEQKGNYAEAQRIYRYSQEKIAPFNVKIAQLLYLQSNHQECIEHCQKIILTMNNYPSQRFLPYTIQLTVQQMKSLIKQKKFELAVSKGQQYIDQIHKDNPKLEYEVFNLNNMMAKSMALIDKKMQREVKDQMISGEHLLRKIYRQIIKAQINLKSNQKAKSYLKLVKLKKQKQFTNSQKQQYYQGRLLQVLILKPQDPFRTIQLINSIAKEVKADDKLDNKESYIKFLLKQKFNLLIQSEKIQQIISQAEEIVQINAVNLIFVKQQIAIFIHKKPSKIDSILSKIQTSKSLNCLYSDLSQKAKNIFQAKIKQQENQAQAKKILDSIQKIDQNAQKQDIFEDQEDDTIEPQHQLTYQPYSEENIEENQVDALENITEDKNYENQICRIHGRNGIEYIVIFDEKIISSLEKSEYHKFVCAADHFVLRENGSTGIKIMGEQIRLKIRSSQRLTGTLMPSKQNKKQAFLHFTKRENHDDYKRQKK